MAMKLACVNTKDAGKTSYEELQRKVRAIVFNVAHNGTLPEIATELIMEATVRYYKSFVKEKHNG